MAASVTFLFFTEHFETFQSSMKYFWPKFQTPEAVALRSSVKEFLFEISQSLQKNIINSKLINIGFKPLLSAYFHFQPAILLKKAPAQLFSRQFSEIFSIIYYLARTFTNGCLCISIEIVKRAL